MTKIEEPMMVPKVENDSSDENIHAQMNVNDEIVTSVKDMTNNQSQNFHNDIANLTAEMNTISISGASEKSAKNWRQNSFDKLSNDMQKIAISKPDSHNEPYIKGANCESKPKTTGLTARGPDGGKGTTYRPDDYYRSTLAQNDVHGKRGRDHDGQPDFKFTKPSHHRLKNVPTFDINSPSSLNAAYPRSDVTHIYPSKEVNGISVFQDVSPYQVCWQNNEISEVANLKEVADTVPDIDGNLDDLFNMLPDVLEEPTSVAHIRRISGDEGIDVTEIYSPLSVAFSPDSGLGSPEGIDSPVSPNNGTERQNYALKSPLNCPVASPQSHLLSPNGMMVASPQSHLLSPNGMMVASPQSHLLSPNGMMVASPQSHLLSPNGMMVASPQSHLLSPNGIMYGSQQLFDGNNAMSDDVFNQSINSPPQGLTSPQMFNRTNMLASSPQSHMIHSPGENPHMITSHRYLDGSQMAPIIGTAQIISPKTQSQIVGSSQQMLNADYNVNYGYSNQMILSPNQTQHKQPERSYTNYIQNLSDKPLPSFIHNETLKVIQQQHNDDNIIIIPDEALDAFAEAEIDVFFNTNEALLQDVDATIVKDLTENEEAQSLEILLNSENIPVKCGKNTNMVPSAEIDNVMQKSKNDSILDGFLCDGYKNGMENDEVLDFIDSIIQQSDKNDRRTSEAAYQVSSVPYNSLLQQKQANLSYLGQQFNNKMPAAPNYPNTHQIYSTNQQVIKTDGISLVQPVMIQGHAPYFVAPGNNHTHPVIVGQQTHSLPPITMGQSIAVTHMNSNQPMAVQMQSNQAIVTQINSNQPMAVQNLQMQSNQPIVSQKNSNQPMAVQMQSNQSIVTQINSNQPMAVQNLQMQSNQPIVSQMNSNQPMAVQMQSNQPFVTRLNLNETTAITQSSPVGSATTANQFIFLPVPVQVLSNGPIAQTNSSQTTKQRKTSSSSKAPRKILPKSPPILPTTSRTSTTLTPSVSRTVVHQAPIQKPVANNLLNVNSTNKLNIARRCVANMTREDLQYMDSDGDTYLHVAVCRTDPHLVQAMLERIERELLLDLIDAQNTKRQTPLYLAVAANQPVMVRLFVKYGADVNSMTQATLANGKIEVKAAIHCAAAGCDQYLNTMRELIQAKDINLNLANSEGLTALHCAVLEHGRPKGDNCSSVEMIQLLIRGGADPNVQDKYTGRTPLMYAIQTLDLNLVERLLSIIDRPMLQKMIKT